MRTLAARRQAGPGARGMPILDTVLTIGVCLLLGLALSVANLRYAVTVSQAVRNADSTLAPLGVVTVPGSLAGPGAGATPGA